MPVRLYRQGGPQVTRTKHEDMLAALADLFIARGRLAHIRSDSGTELISTAVQVWLVWIGVKTLYLTPGSPWESEYNGALTGRFAIN